MKVYLLPKTRLGKWSSGFGTVFAGYFIFVSPLFMILNQQEPGKEDIFIQAIRPLFIAIGLLVMASGILAFITSLISIVKYKERSVLIYITTVIGFFAVFLLLGELLFLH